MATVSCRLDSSLCQHDSFLSTHCKPTTYRSYMACVDLLFSSAWTLAHKTSTSSGAQLRTDVKSLIEKPSNPSKTCIKLKRPTSFYGVVSDCDIMRKSN